MLGSCCACAKEAPAHSAVARTARRALPVELGMDRYNHRTQRRTNDRRAVAREWHGLFRCGASAAARVRRPSIQNIRERYSDHSPRARIPGRLTSRRLVSSARTSAFCQPDPHCLAVLPACHIPPGKLPVCFDGLWMHNSSFERAIDHGGRGDRAGLRISRPTERVRPARRCKEIFLLIWGPTASGVRPSVECFRRTDASAASGISAGTKNFFAKTSFTQRLPPLMGQNHF
jgi:hypothetical protein